jgi:DNA-binding transcriptional LysR family regulator
MWESVELREIRAFLALANELHSAARPRCWGLSQSRVSQVIRQLEAKLGGPPIADRSE